MNRLQLLSALAIALAVDAIKPTTVSEEDQDKIDLLKSKRLRGEIGEARPDMLREANEAIAAPYREQRRLRKQQYLAKTKANAGDAKSCR